MKSVAEFSDRFSELIDGMSFTHVGADIGMSKQTVSAYANGSRNPKKPTISAIAAYYGVNPLWLIGFDAPKYLEKPTPVAEGRLSDIQSIFDQLSDDNRAKLLELSRLYLASQRNTEETE